MKVPAFLTRLVKYLRLTRADEIARRYFVMNGFDGALATLGVIMGSYAAGAKDPRLVLSAGLGASLAMGISGAWGTYMAERAERIRGLKELEEALFAELEGSVLQKASDAAVITVSIVNATSPIVTSLVSLSPFLLAAYRVIGFDLALSAAVALNSATLFTLGAFLGRISRSNVLLYGGLMVLVGFLTALVIMLFSLVA